MVSCPVVHSRGPEDGELPARRGGWRARSGSGGQGGVGGAGDDPGVSTRAGASLKVSAMWRIWSRRGRKARECGVKTAWEPVSKGVGEASCLRPYESQALQQWPSQAGRWERGRGRRAKAVCDLFRPGGAGRQSQRRGGAGINRGHHPGIGLQRPFFPSSVLYSVARPAIECFKHESILPHPFIPSSRLRCCAALGCCRVELQYMCN